jgi:hypothetical protein
VRTWPPLFVPPLTFLALVTIAYAMVPWACETERRAPLHLAALLALAIAGGCTLLAWRNWRDTDVLPPTDEAEPPVPTRFLTVLGLMLSALMCVAIAALWLTQIALTPCLR